MEMKAAVRTLNPSVRRVHRQTLLILANSGVPFLVGGGYALGTYMELERCTRDLDIFVRQKDCDQVLRTLHRHGYRTELTFAHWLGKAYRGDLYIDIIFSSGNAIADVDDEFFLYASSAHVLGVDVLIVPPEEIIWSKAFVMERERFDGADIAHLLRAVGHKLDWSRLIRRFAGHETVLLAHLLLFDYIYPNHCDQVPRDVIGELMLKHLAQKCGDKKELVCNGPILSREQYLIDTHRMGYADARLAPLGKMSAADIRAWTDAIARK